MKRERLLFIELAMMPGPVETAAARMITEMLETEAAAGRMTLPLQAAVAEYRDGGTLRRPPVRQDLLGRDEPEIETALGLAAGAAWRPQPDRAPRRGRPELRVTGQNPRPTTA